MATIPTIPVLPPVKVGDTFELSCIYKQDGIPADITALAIRSQVRDSLGILVEELVPTKADQVATPGKFSLAAAAPIAWPVGVLVSDIEVSESGTVRSSQTFRIPIVDDVTKEVIP